MSSSENNAADQVISKSTDDVNDKIINPPFTSEKSGNDEEPFQIGNIIWARLAGYPYWPSMICLDPESLTHIKGSPDDKSFLVHVRFCNDNGRRSWVNDIQKYCGKDVFLLKYPNGIPGLKRNKKLFNQWNKSVQEADHWLTIARRSRLIRFFRMNNLRLDAIFPPKSTSAPKVSQTNIAEKCDTQRTYNNSISTSNTAAEKFNAESVSSTSKIDIGVSDMKHSGNNESAQKLNNITPTKSHKTEDKKRKKYAKKRKLPQNNKGDDNIGSVLNTVQDETVQDESVFLKRSTLRVNKKRLQEILLLEGEDS